MTGNSTWGKGATGRNWKLRIPASSTPTVSSDVPTGRLMNGEETLKLISRCRLFLEMPEAKTCEALRQAIEPEIDHRGGVQGQQLAQDQAADDGHAQRVAEF